MMGESIRREHGPLVMFATIFLLALLVLDCNAQGETAGEVAPDFQLPGTDGAPHTLSAYSGKVVLINFWASWCTECIAELPALEDLHGRYADKEVVVLSISIDRDEEAMRGVLRKFPVSYTVLRDSTGEVFIDRYTVTSLPTLLLVDRRGIIRDRIEGGADLTSPEFTRKLDVLVAGSRNR